MNERPRRSLAQSGETASLNYSLDRSRRHKPDYWLLILMSLLMGLGLIVVYSISPALAASQHISQSYFITKQIIDVLLGIAAFFIAATFPLASWQRLIKPLIIITAIGCLVVLVTPINSVYPAHRWIRLGSFSFQIAELIKLTMLLWLAAFLGMRRRQDDANGMNQTFKTLLILIGVIGLVVAKLQSDFGSAGVMLAMIVIMSFVAGVPLKRLAAVGTIAALLLALTILPSAYRRERLATYLHPGADCQASGYQVCQALISVGSGGVLGQGLGYGTQAYGYLPEPSNDSIFAVIAEKFGFIGTTVLVVIFGVFFNRLKQVAVRTSDEFSKLIVVGVLVWISVQMAINIGAMIGVFPLKGITLPLISQGGTSLVFLTAAIGLVFQVSRYTSYSQSQKGISIETQTNNSTNRRRLRRAYSPPAVARPRT